MPKFFNNVVVFTSSISLPTIRITGPWYRQEDMDAALDYVASLIGGKIFTVQTNGVSR